MIEEQKHKLLEGLRKSRSWSFIISFAGLFLILFLAWKHMVHDPYFKYRGIEVQFVLYSLVVLGIFRYMLFIRQQLSIGRNNKRSDEQKLEKYYQRSYYFWLFDGIMTTAAAIFFLYLMVGDL